MSRQLSSTLSLTAAAQTNKRQRANIGAGQAQRPDQLRDPKLDGGRTPERWFDTTAFALPAAQTFGSAPRNSVRGPGCANVDFAVAKTWRLPNTSNLELRWEVFNLFNRANFRPAEPYLRQQQQ